MQTYPCTLRRPYIPMLGTYGLRLVSVDLDMPRPRGLDSAARVVCLEERSLEFIPWHLAEMVHEAEAGLNVCSGESHDHSCRHMHLHKSQFYYAFLERGGQEGVKSNEQSGPH